MDSPTLPSVSISALAQGVKLIGIGKHGSKKLPQELITEIVNELLQGTQPPLLIGAFIGALLMKDPEPAYFQLETYFGKESLTNPKLIWEKCCSDAPQGLEPLGLKLLNKELLNQEEAYILGQFLMGELPGEGFRGMAMSILRIRYEDDAEYVGLYQAIQKHLIPIGIIEIASKKIIQLAEPFDGVEHSYIISPLLALSLQKLSYTVVTACGRNSGPKIILNSYDICKELKVPFIKNASDFTQSPAQYGLALDQGQFYPPLEKWVDRRHILMKRPFLATLEKVLNPLGAGILITSVFHISYMEKMVELGKMAGFGAVLVLKRGLEGTLAPSLSKASGLLCAAKNNNGVWCSLSFQVNNKNQIESDAVLENISVFENSRLISQFAKEGKTDQPGFDNYVRTAVSLYKNGLDFIAQVQQP